MIANETGICYENGPENVLDYIMAPRPKWDWVQTDCSRWLDAWLVIRGHPSAMAATGIEYSGAVSAMRVIQRGGGLLALWTAGMDAIGLREAADMDAGDVAILSAPTDDETNETTGIWTGQRWASLHPHGVMFGVGTPLRIWGV